MRIAIDEVDANAMVTLAVGCRQSVVRVYSVLLVEQLLVRVKVRICLLLYS